MDTYVVTVVAVPYSRKIAPYVSSDRETLSIPSLSLTLFQSVCLYLRVLFQNALKSTQYSVLLISPERCDRIPYLFIS